MSAILSGVVVGGAASGAAVSGAPVLIGGSDGTNARTISTDSSGNVNAKIAAALPAGTNALGQVTANAGTNLNTSLLALESGGNLAALAGAVTSSKIQVNNAQISGTAMSVNNGATDAGTTRVTISSDSTGQMKAVGGAASGTAVSGNPVLIAGSDGTNARTFATDTSGNQHINGDVASGATDSGNPVKVGGYASSSTPSAVTSGQRQNLWLSLTGATVTTIGSTVAPGDASSPGGLIDFAGAVRSTYSHLFNGATADRPRNNNDLTILTSARTATTNSGDQTNFNGRGVRIVLSVTAASGTGGLQVQIQGKDSISGSYYQLNTTPAAVTATGTYVYDLYPAALDSAAGGITQKSQVLLPRTWRVNVVAGDSSSYTYSISGITIL